MALVCKQGEMRATSKPGALHMLKATPETIHWGYFSPEIKPALRINSGDLVEAEAITHHAGDAPELMFDEGVERIFREVDPATRAPGVHIMTGPIYVEGAEPGDILEVRYLQMVPRNNFGSNLAANWGHLYEEFGEKERVTIYELDPNANTAHALFAYDFPGKYLVPGTITHCAECPPRYRRGRARGERTRQHHPPRPARRQYR
jgi:acetamidase/formamidase